MRHLIALIIGVTSTFSVTAAAQQPTARSRNSPKQRVQKQQKKPESGRYCPSKKERGSFCLEGTPSVSGHRGCTELMRAAEAGRLDKVRVLLAAGADVDAKFSHGHTALMLAAIEGHLEIVKVLLAAGANPNALGATFHSGAFAAWMSAMNRCNTNWLEIMEAMIAAGVALNPKTGIYLSPLGYAISKSDPVLVRALLKLGADVNLSDPQTRETLLMFASKYSSPEVVKALLDAGADVNVKDSEGKTALAIIEDYGENIWQEEIVRLLKKSGATK